MWKKFLIDTFMPQFCLKCRTEGSLVCEDCLSTIEILEKQYCAYCGKTNCRCKGNIRKLYTAAPYENHLVRKMINNEYLLKTMAQPLSFLIISHFLMIEKEPKGIFIPMPIDKKEKREKGFSQAEEIAKILTAYFPKGKAIYLVNDIYNEEMKQYAETLEQDVYAITVARKN